MNVIVPRTNTQFAERHFAYPSTIYWNMLPVELKQGTFFYKTCLRDFLVLTISYILYNIMPLNVITIVQIVLPTLNNCNVFFPNQLVVIFHRCLWLWITYFDQSITGFLLTRHTFHRFFPIPPSALVFCIYMSRAHETAISSLVPVQLYIFELQIKFINQWIGWYILHGHTAGKYSREHQNNNMSS